jgi:hypothetical protein
MSNTDSSHRRVTYKEQLQLRLIAYSEDDTGSFACRFSQTTSRSAHLLALGQEYGTENYLVDPHSSHASH